MNSKNSKHLSKGQILTAQAATLSNQAAARYLGCSYQHYRKYAKAYGLLESHKNVAGVGIPKFKKDKVDKYKMQDIYDGNINPAHFNPEKLKYRMIEAGLMKDECYNCGFHEKRLIDNKVPLLLNFRDGNKGYWRDGNAEFLCYNCYFLIAGDIFTKNDIKDMETSLTPKTTTKAINMEIDDYTKKRLRELGLLGEDETPGSQYISRI